MIDPTRITNFERTDNELQAFALFALLVAGKNSDVTARFFLLHSRRHVNVAVLDVHVLRWMRRFYEDAPTNTPQGLDYVKWENLYCSLRTAYYPCMSAADADLMIWMKESGRSENA